MNKFKTTALLAAIALTGFGCQSTTGSAGGASASASAAVAPAPDFESAQFAQSIKGKKSKVELVQGTGVTVGKNAVKIDFEGVSEANKNKFWPNAFMTPAGGVWDWSDKESFTVDVTNPTDEHAFINFKVVDQAGTTGGGMPRQLNHKVMIPAGATENVEVVFRASLYSLPGYWGGDDLDLSKIKEVKIFIQGPIEKQTIILDNFTLIGPQS
ncbi:hypothetical protein BCU70_09645 [Vibrio sp. 10N.286.49.C2]|uniref:hypothetical protein n=1 Tax=unclassified Vibrio TaxID=2614977 RepID=UPI000C81FB9B|nr:MULTISPECIES: hypothetical protein [unclassified Vibrio]PMH26409.1 hypothetical protein BCU70_09645 [Vibrio sp. 10N.286.49.C2]PMH54867.1 hypothetical protein BCU66_11290 [Vibrio sp. 10N.286.49.B1]PMH84106.1 hypothetical protein BCU58_00140 [Vibrio sp. 10N.286.48.B7]